MLGIEKGALLNHHLHAEEVPLSPSEFRSRVISPVVSDAPQSLRPPMAKVREPCLAIVGRSRSWNLRIDCRVGGILSMDLARSKKHSRDYVSTETKHR